MTKDYANNIENALKSCLPSTDCREKKLIDAIPTRKHEEDEIAERPRIQGSFPQTSFDLGCQGELTQ